MPVDRLAEVADALLDRAYVPYGRQPSAAVVLLSDGSMVPGVRVENASYSLTISPAVGAVATAYSRGRRDVRAVVVRPYASPAETAFLGQLFETPLHGAADGSFFRSDEAPIPDPADLLSLPEWSGGSSHDDLLREAREARGGAVVPASSFAVGCAGVAADRYLVRGANVEHADWSFILCAERVVIATARAYGLGPIQRLALACDAPGGCTPCGACRQVLLEHAPDAALWIDRSDAPPETLSVGSLLPAPFSDANLMCG